MKAQGVAHFDELVVGGVEEQPQDGVAKQRATLRVGEVGEVLCDHEQRAGDVAGPPRPLVQPRARGRRHQRLPRLINRDERAPRPRTGGAAGTGEVVCATLLDVAVDEVDQREDHGSRERVGKPREIEEMQRRAARDRGLTVSKPRDRPVANVRVQPLGQAPELGRDAGIAVVLVGDLLAREATQLLLEEPLARRFAAHRAALVHRLDPAREECALESSQRGGTADRIPDQERVQRDEELALGGRDPAGIGDVPGVEDRVALLGAEVRDPRARDQRGELLIVPGLTARAALVLTGGPIDDVAGRAAREVPRQQSVDRDRLAGARGTRHQPDVRAISLVKQIDTFQRRTRVRETEWDAASTRRAGRDQRQAVADVALREAPRRSQAIDAERQGRDPRTLDEEPTAITNARRCSSRNPGPARPSTRRARPPAQQCGGSRSTPTGRRSRWRRRGAAPPRSHPPRRPLRRRPRGSACRYARDDAARPTGGDDANGTAVVAELVLQTRHDEFLHARHHSFLSTNRAETRHHQCSASSPVPVPTDDAHDGWHDNRRPAESFERRRAGEADARDHERQPVSGLRDPKVLPPDELDDLTSQADVRGSQTGAHMLHNGTIPTGRLRSRSPGHHAACERPAP